MAPLAVGFPAVHYQFFDGCFLSLSDHSKLFKEERLLRRLVLWAGLVAVSTASGPGQKATQSSYEHDPRLVRLVQFFDDFSSPAKALAPDFLAAADMYHLDWRLLPSISLVESGGGKTALRNNMFGWNSARSGFATTKEGIYFVAARLHASKLYKGKELDALLATYNPRAEWAHLVKSVMRQVGPPAPAAETADERPALSRVGELRRPALQAPALSQ